ncbi:DoxX family protein [Flavobacterium zepuense]|uniref:DoxX family protein n=1 Tax=Flavobacterium zepuense TaxID=2593302 RepID=A0A552V635_9FLAO|nr:DoxX family protein [Flavobacterium zepuense]TRW25930.1 DoxX family protein [Flavobacterium zepuense]
MKRIFIDLIKSDLKSGLYNFGILFFRVAIASELIYVHGLKKIGIGVAQPEVIPNPIGLPDALNNFVAIAANVYLPFLIIIGLFTRVAALPALAVTATGYFLMHFNDDPMVRDMPFMYATSLLLIVLLGGGRYSLDNLIYNKLNKDA